jgi:hypothetical protein
VIIEPVEENLGELGALFEPLAQGMTELWAQFNDEELDIIIRFARQSNIVTAEVNARLRGSPTD